MAKETKRENAPTPDGTLRAIRKGELSPMYWLYGAEPYWIEKMVEALRAVVLQGSPRGFNFDLFIGKETSASQISQAARTLPMMAPRRLVLVKDAHELKAAELEQFSNYIKAPPKETVLVFVSEKVDKRLKFFLAFQKEGLLVECKALYENQIGPWLLDEARTLGIILAPDVPELLVRIIGTSMITLTGALQKISLYLSPKREVSSEDALAAIADTRARSSFELTQAIGKKDLGRALATLQKITEHDKQSDVIIPLLGTIAWQWRQLIKGSILKAKGLPKGEVLKELGIFYRQADEFWDYLSRFEPKELREKHEELMKADLALKSSPLEGVVIIELLVMRLCS
jgi:DNA polymerase III subunit delta